PALPQLYRQAMAVARSGPLVGPTRNAAEVLTRGDQLLGSVVAWDGDRRVVSGHGVRRGSAIPPPRVLPLACARWSRVRRPGGAVGPDGGGRRTGPGRCGSAAIEPGR